MKLKGAMTVLKKEMEFLGLTFDELCIFIERNPYAQKNSTIEAYNIYKQETDDAEAKLDRLKVQYLGY